jgi:hypothetical protein
MVVTAVLLVAGGCERTGVNWDNSQVAVFPGLGVSNVCEVGMTYRQIQTASPDASTHGLRDRTGNQGSWVDGRFALIPSLGAITFLGTNQPASIIEFHVRPHSGELISGLEVRNPFRGRIGNILSFKDHSVGGQEVEAAWGSVTHTATNDQGTFDLIRWGERFRLSRTASVEEIWYPQAGIAFVLESNVVSSFKVFQMRVPETKGQTVK